MQSDSLYLWKQLSDFELDDSDSPTTFTDRLARENGWTHGFAVRAIHEYKRFLFLVYVTNESLTPSDEIDQVWHLHLLYTHSYWDDLCGNLLKRKIHHGPTKGGNSEKQKFANGYLRTIELYKSIFNQSPPDDIWPSTEIRFKNVNFQRINIDTHWVIKKPFK